MTRTDTPNDRIKKAVDIAFQYGGVDGSHHQLWVIDQMLRALLGENYEAWVIEFRKGEDGPETYDWDTGIAP